jgi:phage tail-like protein
MPGGFTPGERDMPGTAQRVDPYRNFNFQVEIGSITYGFFTDCSGFGASNDPIEYREGGDQTTDRKLPGKTKYPNIVLKWGVTDTLDLYTWFNNIVQGQSDRRNGSIILYDLDGVTEKVRWNFINAWPTKYTGTTLSAKANEAAIDTLELTVEQLFRVTS